MKCPCAFRLRRLAQNECRGGVPGHFYCKFPHEMALVRSPVQPSRRFGPVRSLSLWRGAHFEMPRTTLSSLWACQISLVVARCSFSLSRRSCAEILTRRSLLESLRGDLVQRSCQEISYRDLAKRALIDSLYRDLFKSLAKRPLIDLYADLARPPLLEILYRDIA